MAKWMVECRYLGGWGDAEWTDDDVPLRFKTKKEAEAAIDEFIQETKQAYRRGHMAGTNSRHEYRAVKEKPNA